MKNLSHLDQSGEANMVDISSKNNTKRKAVASGIIKLKPTTCKKIVESSHHKGDVIAVARVAGIMAAKKTADTIPLCHPIEIVKVSIQFEIAKSLEQILCSATVENIGKTGVEIEALHAVQISLLTIYDMCKSVDKTMEIGSIKVIHKSGGKSGEWNLSKK